MSVKKANEAQFYFFCGQLPPETFEVMSFEGVDEVSEPYLFNLLLLAESETISADDVINKISTLYIYRDGEYYPFSGVAIDFRFLGKNYDHASYEITLAPRLWLLGLTKQTRIFQNKKATQIVKEVLDGANLANYYTINVDVSKLPDLEYVVQYQESDLNFISRLLEDNGIWYQFNENPILREELDGSVGAEHIVISDRPATFDFIATTSDIQFRSHSGFTERDDTEEKESINSLHCIRQIAPTRVLVRDYNYRTPEVDLTGQKPITGGSVGTVYEYGTSHLNATDGQRLAEIRANRLAVRMSRYDGSGNCRGFRAGKRFTLENHFNSALDGAYVLLRVAHFGAHPMSGERANMVTYTNDFQLITASNAPLFKPDARAYHPRIDGIMSSQIEANGSNYASIDDSGRYKVRMPFDMSSTANSSGSSFIRLASPYSGQNYGIHFPSHEGTEMLWACVDGDPSRPVGIATIPNANTKSPVTGPNKQNNIIRTAGGNELVMDDTDAKQKVKLKTSAANNLLFDDENKKIAITTTNNNALLMDDQNKKVQINADANTIVMDYQNKCITITSAGGHVVKIDDQGKMITIQSKAGNAFQMDDNGKKIVMKDAAGKNTVTLDGNKGLDLTSTGKITINASQDLEIKGANVKITASTGKVDVKATSDLTLSGGKITGKASGNLNLEGSQIAAKGSMGVKIAGMTVEVKADLSAKIEGLTTELSGSVMTTIKGGVVMIN